MGTTLLELFPFRLRSIAFALTSGYCFYGWLPQLNFLPEHSVLLFCNPSLSDFAFYGITFLLSLQLTSRLTFPDGVLFRTPHSPFLTI